MGRAAAFAFVLALCAAACPTAASLAQPAAAAPVGLSFRLVDDADGPGAHPGETQAAFRDQMLWLEPEAPITGDMVASARPFLEGPDQRPGVAFELTPAGAERLAALSKANLGRRMAILVDGRVVAAPRIQAEITGGKGVIMGDFDRREASLLALQINDARTSAAQRP